MIDYRLHYQFECQSFVKTHEANGNSMQPQNIGAIALWPTRKEQGGLYFYNLAMGKISGCRCRTFLYRLNNLITEFMHWQVQYIVREATFLNPTGFLKHCRRGLQKCRIGRLRKSGKLADLENLDGIYR